MYSSTKLDVLPLLPVWNAAAAVLPFVEPMLPVKQVGEAVVGALPCPHTCMHPLPSVALRF